MLRRLRRIAAVEIRYSSQQMFRQTASVDHIATRLDLFTQLNVARVIVDKGQDHLHRACLVPVGGDGHQILRGRLGHGLPFGL